MDAEGIHATEGKLQALKNIQELRSFLGLMESSYLIFHPLNDLLHKDTKWNRSSECQDSFSLAKETLISSKVLTHYTATRPIKLECNDGIGAVISHVFPDGSERPVAFASRTLTSSEKKYTQVEKEALSLILALSFLPLW